MLNTNVQVYNEGSQFKFNVDAVSGTLHKSTRKSKLCVRDVNDKSYIFDDECPRLLGNSEEIVVLQTMLTGGNKILVEYMTRKDYDEMFDGPLPDVNVRDMLSSVRDKVQKDISSKEHYEKMFNEADKDPNYYDKRNDRRWMAEELTENIVKKVCEYLENKHIGTFDFSNTTCAYNGMIFSD